jgi:hypothetical protein
MSQQQNGVQIVDKRRNVGGAAPPAAGPTVQTSTLPANPNPGAIPSWAGGAGAPQGARPPARPLGGGSAVQAAAPLPAATTLSEHLTRHQHAIERLPPGERALVERLAAPTPNVWAGEAPEQGKSSITDQVFWSLGNASIEDARGWFPQVPFPLWNALVALYMVSGGPAWLAPGETLAAVPSDGTPDEEDEPTDAEIAAAHAPLGSSASDSTEAAGLAAAEAALKEEDAASGDAAGGKVKRMSKALRGQIRELFVGGGTDEQISEALAYPVDRVAAERAAWTKEGGQLRPAAVETPAPSAAASVTATTSIAPDGTASPTTITSPAMPAPTQADLVEFLTGTAFMLTRNAQPTLEELDAVASKLLRQLEAYGTFRGRGTL